MDPSKRILVGFGVCILAAFVVFAYVYVDHLSTQKMTEESTGIVTQVSRGRGSFITVEHYVNNNRHVGRIGSRLRGRLREGMQIKIYYDPANPSQLRADRSTIRVLFWFFIFFLLFIGGLYAIKKGLRELNGKPLSEEKPLSECNRRGILTRLYEWDLEREAGQFDFKKHIPYFVGAIALAVIFQWMLY